MAGVSRGQAIAASAEKNVCPIDGNHTCACLEKACTTGLVQLIRFYHHQDCSINQCQATQHTNA